MKNSKLVVLGVVGGLLLSWLVSNKELFLPAPAAASSVSQEMLSHAGVSAGIAVVAPGKPIGPVTPVDGDDKCDNCDGKGWLGDGVPRGTCPVCDGTGKKPKEDSNEGEAPPEESADKPKQVSVESEDCADGSCDSGDSSYRVRRWGLFRRR